jgi:ribosome-associated protein
MINYRDTELYIYIQAISARKASDIVILNLKGESSVADFFMICSAQSTRQVASLSQFIVSYLKDNGIKPISFDTLSEAGWHVLDYGDVVIHIFYEPVREFYDLEGLWADADKIEIKED